MREIKFRGLSVDNKKFVSGFLVVGQEQITNKNPKVFTTNYCIVNQTKKQKITGEFHSYHVHPETIGQYTERKDTTGQEIYEGDIVVDKYNIRGEVMFGIHVSKKIRIIGFYLKVGQYENTNFIEQFYIQNNYKIIGNIHEGVNHE